LYAAYLPAPFLSLLIDDCISTGQDYHAGGARYNTSYIQGVGLGTITDALAAIKYHVFDRQPFMRSLSVASRSSTVSSWSTSQKRQLDPINDAADRALDQRHFAATSEKPAGSKLPVSGLFAILLLIPHDSEEYIRELR